MSPAFRTSITMTTCATFVALLAACGGGDGGGGAGSDAATATIASVSAAPAVAMTAQVPVNNGATRVATTSLTVRAHGSMAGGVGPLMEVRVNGNRIALVEVRATQPQDYTFNAGPLAAGDRVDVAFTNDAGINGEDRNLFVSSISDGTTTVTSTEPGVVLDAGVGEAAYDGLNTSAGGEALWGPAALRFVWPGAGVAAVSDRDAEVARFLQQATFGPTPADFDRLRTVSFATWINEQMAMAPRSDMLAYIQGKYDQGPEFQPPMGARYTPDWINQKFWMNAATATDPLRKRVAFAWHSIFVVSQADSNLFHQSRAYAAYLDNLDRLAFGNYRVLIEELALSPAMGIYLSHMRNLKEDPATNRLPDENFARELLQLFSIGLHELNMDGSPKLDAQGKPIETYGNADVMAMAKVFTGWSWGFDDTQLTDYNFRWGWPDARTTAGARVDVRRMKAYPAMASVSEKRLFAGRPHAVTIPANTGPAESVRIALDAVFNHPNVGPFIGRQLIQRLVTSNPSPAYVARVAQVFNNNGQGVRGDLGAVVRAVLLDDEARRAPAAHFGKVREPVLRVAQWMRAFGAQSASGEFAIGNEPQGLGQKAHNMGSVFGYFRPGYVPPNTTLADLGLGAPEMQIVDEGTTANWVNDVELMLREGLGWFGTSRDVTTSLTYEASLAGLAPAQLVTHLNKLLFAGQMSPGLKKGVLDAIQGVPQSAANRDKLRAQVALFVALTSPEYLVQR